MKKHKRLDAQKLRQSKNVPRTEKRQSLRRCGRETENVPHICYSPTRPGPGPGQQQHTPHYRIGGTKRIALEQTVNLKSAVDFAKSIGLPLVAHLTIHWVGTDAGDDADGELFAEVRETFSRWFRYRDVPFAGIWVREKKAGGMSEVEHAHLIFHLPDAWLRGARLVGLSGGVDGSDELLELQAVLYRIVRRCAGRPDDYAVKLKIPTDGGNLGPYNGRSYDGLYLLKGGGQQAWRLFPRIKEDQRKPQGLIFNKRCGVTQNLGSAARRRAGFDGEKVLWERAKALGLKKRTA
jgi:hypothetical protein